MKKNENGEIMLESLIVYSITIMLLFFILAVFSVLFQRWNIQVIANETATRVAQTYRFSTADTVTGKVSVTDLVEVHHYRYFFYGKEYESSADKKIKEYAKERLAKTTFTKNVSEPSVSAVVVRDGLSRRHIEVTIKGEYSVPFGEVLSYFGFDGTITYETTAYAECVDMCDYINTIDFVEDQLSFKKFKSELIGMINKLLEMING